MAEHVALKADNISSLSSLPRIRPGGYLLIRPLCDPDFPHPSLQVAALLPNRTDSSVRNRWMRLMKESNATRETDAARMVPQQAQPVPSPLQTATTPLTPSTAMHTNTAMGQQGPPLHKEPSEVLLGSLKQSLQGERLPLGLDAPTMVLDLDSFVEAVTACVQDPSVRSPAKPAEPIPTNESHVRKAPADDFFTSEAAMDKALESVSGTLNKLTFTSAALATFAAASLASTPRPLRTAT